MKKHVLAIIICICVLLGVAIPASGSALQDNNTLVSLSYLNGTYLQELAVSLSEQISAVVKATYSEAKQTLDSLGQSYMNQLAPEDAGGIEWLKAASFYKQGGETGDTVTLAVGAGLIWQVGSAQLSGELIDLTDGKEITGGEPQTGHRYVAVKESIITIHSTTAYWSVEGEWQTTSDGVTIPDVFFEDVPLDSPYYEAVRYVVNHGLFIGTSETKFSPDVTINRGMMATVLHRFAGEPLTVYRPVFTDVADGKWYTPGVIWAADSTVVIGMGDDTYRPSENLTYQQVGIMFYNYAKWAGIDTSAQTDLALIPGGSSVASWAKEQMSWAVAVGIMVTDDNGNLTPKDDCSRADVAVMMQRFNELVNQ